MSVTKPGLFSSLSNPFKGSRYFGLFFIVLIIMGALGLGYYLNVVSNQERYAAYRFRSLNDLEGRFEKLLENKVQQANQKEAATRDSALNKVFRKPVLSSVAEGLPWQDSFEEFIIEEKTGTSGQVIFHSFESSIGNLSFAKDSTYSLEKRVKFMNEEYRVFANTYPHPASMVNTKDEGVIIFYGLVKQSSFDRENLRLDVWLIIILGMVLILILLGLPFFKLIFISEIERLYRRDVVLTGLSIVVGVPVLALIFFSLFHYGNRYYLDIPDLLKEQSKTISERFQNENELIVEQLYQIRDKVDNMFVGKSAIEPGRTYFPLDVSSDLLHTYNNFKVIGKVSDKGEINRQLISTRPVPQGDLKDLSGRSYFKAWKAGDHSYLEGNTKPYVMRPVISLEAGTEEAIYVVPVEDNSNQSCLIAASVSLKSLHDPILAKGYQFAIVDHDGDVLFHSKPGRSTLENILTSTLEDAVLMSALETNATTRTYFDYMGDPVIGFIRPIPGHDLHIISMYNIQFLRLQISEIVSLGSIGIISAILVTGFLALITIFSRQPKGNFYKYTRFPFRFLEPDRDKMRGYLILIVCFMLQILCNGFFIYNGQQGTSTVFLSNLLLMLWAYIFVYYRFNLLTKRRAEVKEEKEDPEKKGNINFWRKERSRLRRDLARREEKLEIRSWRPRLGDLFIVFFIILFNFFLNNTLENGYGVLFLIQALFLVMMVVSLILGSKVDAFLTAVVAPFGKKSYRQIYIIFLFVWLFLTSVFPSYHYFLEASRIEQEIWNKDAQLGLAKDYEAKSKKLKQHLKFASDEADHIHNEHLETGYYDVNKADFEIKPVSSVKKDRDGALKSLLYRIRPVYDENVASNQPLVYDVAFGDKWFWHKPQKTKAITLNYKLEAQDNKGFILKYDQGTDTEPTFFKSKSATGALFWIITISLMVGVYALIYFAVNRIFGFHYERYRQKDKMLEDCQEQIRQVISRGERPANLAIVGFPFSGKLSMIMKILNENKGKHIASISCMNLKGKVGELNFILKPQSEPDALLTGDTSITAETIIQKESNELQDLKGFDTIIIQNFEFGYQNDDMNKLKLDLISFLVGYGKHVIILTDIYPSQILAFYRRAMEGAEAPSAEQQQSFNAWHSVFGSFTDILYGFKHDRKSVHEGIELFEKNHLKQVESSTIRLAENELGFGTYLPTLVEPTLTRTARLINYEKDVDEIYVDLSEEYYDTTVEEKEVALYESYSDQFILQVQSMAHGYYNNIWNSLATREKFIAYDLARDGFVNTKNGSALYSLMKKGLVVWKNKPLLFNKSFRNFVIASVSREEAKAMQKVINKNGSWGIARIVLYMVIIGLVGFLMIGEPQFISDFQTFVGVLAGLATVVPVLSSFIGSKPGAG